MTNDDDQLPEGPLDPFDDDVELGSGPDDQVVLHSPGTMTRVVSSLIDILFISVIFFAGSTVLAVPLIHPVKGHDLTDAQNRKLALIAVIVSVVLVVLFVLLERLWGGTPGRRMLRLRLVTLAGERPPIGRLVLRFFPILLAARIEIASPLLFLATFISVVRPDRRDGLDLLAGTRVIDPTG